MGKEIEKEKKAKFARIREKRKKFREATSDSVQYLEYDNEKVQIDIYNPGRKSCSVVILLHGAKGITGDRAARYRGFATSLKKRGIIAINIHYFDCKGDKAKAVRKAIDYAENIPNADAGSIGIVGYSAGGTLALIVASNETRLKALVINSGYLPIGLGKEDAARLPRTYMISGSKDHAMNTLLKLKKWFGELGKPFESRINRGYGHSVPVDIFEKDWNTTVDFFVRHLK